MRIKENNYYIPTRDVHCKGYPMQATINIQGPYTSTVFENQLVKVIDIDAEHVYFKRVDGYSSEDEYYETSFFLFHRCFIEVSNEPEGDVGL